MGHTTEIIIGASLALFVFLSAAIMGVDRPIFLPSHVSGAHERFVAGCDACHEKWKGPTEKRCMTCHEEALSGDTHSKEKLSDPVRAVIPVAMKGIGCVSCHREHMPGAKEGYTGPDNFCVTCHKPGSLNHRHVSFSPASCSDESCHTFHSNLSEQEYKAAGSERLEQASKTVEAPAPEKAPRISAAAMASMRNNHFFRDNAIIAAQYEISPHYGTKATCMRCHETKSGGLDKTPPAKVCAECHKSQTGTFGAGSHGAPDALGVEQYVKKEGRVGCGSCHNVHSLFMEEAGTQACLKCHDSEHAVNYMKSGHYRYLSDPVFQNKAMTGVDCAGCHMPRSKELGGATNHNESLSVSSKPVMARTVCARCHGMRYALRSLYSDDVILSNFTYSPSGRLPAGLEYAFGPADRW